MSESLSQTAVYSSLPGSANPQHYSAFRLFTTGLNSLLGLIERQRQRKALGSLNEHQLRDIGISAAEARRAASKPFWR